MYCHSEAPVFGARNLLSGGVSDSGFLLFAALIVGMTNRSRVTTFASISRVVTLGDW